MSEWTEVTLDTAIAFGPDVDSLQLYAGVIDDAGTPRPLGSPLAEESIEAGAVTFTELDPGTRYAAGARIDDAWIFLLFSTPLEPPYIQQLGEAKAAAVEAGNHAAEATAAAEESKGSAAAAATTLAETLQAIEEGKVKGEQGDVGPQGEQGIQGEDGGVRYFGDLSVAEGEPATGYFRLNNAAPNAATKLFISETDASSKGSSQAAWLQSFDDSTSPVKGFLVITRSGGGATVFKVTGAVVDHGGWDTIPISYVSGSTDPLEETTYHLVFSRTGDEGEPGAAGTTVISGTIDSNGNVVNGTKFTVAKGGNGEYNITLKEELASAGAIVAMPTNAFTTIRTSTAAVGTKKEFQVLTYKGEVKENSGFNFYVIATS
jgi:hypothetical protein